MSYNTIARAAQDGDLQQRLMAAAAQENHPNPQGFVNEYITDAAILAVVQPLVVADVTP